MRTLPSPETLAAVVSGVTETMLGLTFEPDGADAPWANLVWRAAVMPIPGAYPLTVGLSSDRPGCRELGARLFQIPVERVSDEMLADSLCELVNMTAGLLKAQLKLDQTLGLPRLMPENQPPLPPPVAESNHLVLHAGRVKLILWVFEGLLQGLSPSGGADARHPDR